MAVGGAGSTSVCWEWRDDYDWQEYDPMTSNFIEQLYQQQRPDDVQLGQISRILRDYTVNVSTMVQTRLLTGWYQNNQTIMLGLNFKFSKLLWSEV